MRYILSAALLALFITNANALACGIGDKFAETLNAAPYYELLMVELHKDNGAKLQIFHNTAKGNWTLLGFISPTQACIIEAGSRIEPARRAARPEKR